MAVKHYDIEFKDGYNGVLKAPKADIEIGLGQGKVLPYDMLYGALASCLYATFLDVVEKKKIEFEACTLHVSGEKREEVPTTLKWVTVEFQIHGAPEGKEKAMTKSAELACKYCSIYQTIAQVADMNFEVTFL